MFTKGSLFTFELKTFLEVMDYFTSESSGKNDFQKLSQTVATNIQKITQNGESLKTVKI